MTNIESLQQNFCHDKHTFAETKDVFCCNNHMFHTCGSSEPPTIHDIRAYNFNKCKASTLYFLSVWSKHTSEKIKRTYFNRITQNCKFSWQHPFSSDKHKNKWVIWQANNEKKNNEISNGNKIHPTTNTPTPQKKTQQHNNHPTATSKETRHMSHGQTMDEKHFTWKKYAHAKQAWTRKELIKTSTQSTHQNISTQRTHQNMCKSCCLWTANRKRTNDKGRRQALARNEAKKSGTLSSHVRCLCVTHKCRPVNQAVHLRLSLRQSWTISQKGKSSEV